MSTNNRSALSFYRSGELHMRRSGSLLVTAGRCTTTTTSTCVACVEIVIEVEAN